MNAPTLGLSAPHDNLVRILAIRWLLILCLIVGVVSAYYLLKINLPYTVILSLITLLLVINGGTWLRLKKSWPVSAAEFFLQILLDIVGVTVLFYFSGGASNPFVSYYLVPLTISIATLPWRYTWVLAVLSVSCYTLLLFYHVPLPDFDPIMTHDSMENSSLNPMAFSELNAHVLGMWFNFLVSVGLITFFVVRMSSALREREAQLIKHREQDLRDEQILAVANIAAGTAHELGSPLTTMKVLLSEIEHGHEQDSQLQQDISILKNQIDLCSQTLKKLVSHSDVDKQNQLQVEDVAGYCARVFEQWLLMRPDVKATIHIDKTAPKLNAKFHSTIDQAIINLLNNAGDASPDSVSINATWNNQRLILAIDDSGPGISDEVSHQLGQAFVTTKGRGLGLGLFLSNATLNRYGGTLKFYNKKEGGTRTEIIISLSDPNENDG